MNSLSIALPIAGLCFILAFVLWNNPIAEAARKRRKELIAKQKNAPAKREREIITLLKQIRDQQPVINHNVQNNYKTNNYVIQTTKKEKKWKKD